MLTDAQRQELVKNARLLIDNKAYVDYGSRRPFTLYTKTELETLFSQKKSVLFDCSASIIQLYYMSGGKDPSGYNFEGYGNTESMIGNLKHYSNPINAHPGALIVFNADQPLAIQHVVMVMVAGRDPMCFTHGGQGDPQEYPLSWLKPGFRGSTVCLDVSPL